MRSIGSVAIALLSLAACREAVTEPPPLRQFTPPTEVTEFLVKETRLVNGAVSVHLDIPLSPPGPKPVVIALIGDRYQLVGAGFVAVTYSIDWSRLKGPPPTPPPAEQTVGKWVLASPSAGMLGETYLRGIAGTASEYVPTIIDWLATVPEVDATRIGMAGGSTNGFVTLQAVAADRRISAAVVISACGDYHRFLRYSSMGMEGKPLDLDPAYDRWIRSQEIIRHPHRLVHAALLMVNHVADELIPISCADETARVLADAYARAGVSDRFRFLRVEQAGHGFRVEENSELIGWFQNWLRPP
jgi:hypothetical protein